MKRRHIMRHIITLTLALALLVVALALTACGSSNDDRAMVEKLFAAWNNHDVAAIQQLYAADAVIYQPELPQTTIVGIQAISDQAKVLGGWLSFLGEDLLVWTPSDEEVKALAGFYQKAAGSRFVAAPTLIAGLPGLTVIEIRDGKVLNEWDTYMFWY